jgi:capsular polysaccharide biosynthesis protein
MDIQLFNWADVVIGPHGAGFSNLVFCKPKTVVIEIGWDGTSTMEMDNMYSSANTLQQWWLKKGRHATIMGVL